MSPVLWTSDAGVSITALLVDKSDIIVATKDGMSKLINIDTHKCRSFLSDIFWPTCNLHVTTIINKTHIKLLITSCAVCWLNSDGKVTHRTHVECGVSRIIRDGTHLYAWGHSQAAYTKWKGALFGKFIILRTKKP